MPDRWPGERPTSWLCLVRDRWDEVIPPHNTCWSNARSRPIPAPGVGKSGLFNQARMMNSNCVERVRPKRMKTRPRRSPQGPGWMSAYPRRGFTLRACAASGTTCCPGRPRTPEGHQGATAHASLAVLGVALQQLDLFGPIREGVQIAQMTVRYTPGEKLYDAFVALLADVQGMVELNRCLRADPGLQVAFGHTACAEQSVVQDTLDACTAENVAQMEQAMDRISRAHSRGSRHDYDRDWQILDVDMSGLPCGKKTALATTGYFTKQRRHRGRQLGRVLAAVYQEVVIDRLFAGNVQLRAALQPLSCAKVYHPANLFACCSMARCSGATSWLASCTSIIARPHNAPLAGGVRLVVRSHFRIAQAHTNRRGQFNLGGTAMQASAQQKLRKSRVSKFLVAPYANSIPYFMYQRRS